ncbi:MAG TPA: PQQ-binding-like beta-propeller repeat protein, partial [Chthonomonadales bacterium]|nr:PQQ-binding-like beta-propeller repeat protein [Chthonomonadales bacterium]
MRRTLVELGVPVVAGVLGVVALGVWVGGWLRFPAVPDRPVSLEPVAEAAASAATPPAGGAAPSAVGAAPLGVGAGLAATPGAGAPAAAGGLVRAANLEVPPAEGLWPSFRGPNRDGISPERVRLARSWPAQGPPVLWSLALGEGYAAAAVRNGRVYVLDYDTAAQADTLRCFALADGRELWRQSYPVQIRRNHGISRTVPAVTDRHVVTIGPKLHVMCVDAVTGELKWRINLVEEYGATVPEWYAGQCPLIVGDKVIIATGGRALVVALDLETGRRVWQSPNPRGWAMTHSSLAPMTLGGEPTVVYCGSGGVAGISLRDGRILWETEQWFIRTAMVPTPVVLPGNRIFLSGGYNAGSLMLQLERQGGNWTPRELFRLPPRVFGSDQQTPIFYEGYIYGVRPGGELVCIDLNGNERWSSGTTRRFGIGP